MAIKMRVLYNSKKKGMEQLAQAIRAEYELPVNAVDGKIPPAYPCTVGCHNAFIAIIFKHKKRHI